jgi:diacylglycerol kinase family enzyme
LNVSVGIGSIMMSEDNRQIKRRFGKLPDLWRGVIELMGFHTFYFEMTFDEKQARFRASELIVANCGIIGLKSVRLDPDIRMDDGRMNVCRIYAINLIDYLKLGISVALGKQKENWNVLCLNVSQEVEIHSKEKLPLQADGEIIGHLPAKVKLIPKALHIVTPIGSEL